MVRDDDSITTVTASDKNSNVIDHFGDDDLSSIISREDFVALGLQQNNKLLSKLFS